MSNICNNLKSIRIEKGYSQQSIADTIGVDRSTYIAWEKGNRAIGSDFLVILANTYNVSTDYLLGLSDCRSVDNAYIKDKLGIDDSAITNIKGYDDNIKDLLNRLSSPNTDILKYLLDTMYGYALNYNSSYVSIENKMLGSKEEYKTVKDVNALLKAAYLDNFSVALNQVQQLYYDDRQGIYNNLMARLQLENQLLEKQKEELEKNLKDLENNS